VKPTAGLRLDCVLRGTLSAPVPVQPPTTNLIDDAEPLRVRVHARSSLRRDSDLLIDQILAIDNRVLVKGPLARLEEESMERVGIAAREVLDIG
jgi:mRNA interferase MazF